ncbi:hypothetical protein B0T26DRAFT_683280 [Lasiosphaeria miniovina]|uniref:Uncharacterized protein n=1 Tax=Lasiosphaeria miniovina TaxID=1954250 RepID=A0AA40BFG8_9PEZI|nr:uncharacterized protein B0T26DRAFT_683280 [Lasiosphaeria miniovina]KAK0733257.1 hypothetical protein B0T26DRAFT_683280 [Lasiosphaeria miniovina]
MASNTRSRIQAPAGRIYGSSPAPQQAQFPARRRVVKTYGRKSKTSSARALRQQTLTQIDYVRPPGSGDDADALLVDKKRSQKRRKTMGDTPNSSFHTQTLTQFLSGGGAGARDDDDMLLIKDSEDEEDESAGGGDDGGSDGEAEGGLLTFSSGATLGKRNAGEEPRAGRPSSAPQTPSHKRIKVNLDEIPSSQPTPFTPMLDRYSPMPGRSPLEEKSTNINAPSPILESMSKRPRNSVIQDSYSPGSRLSSSLPASSPVKETPSRRPYRQPLAEIPMPSFDLGDNSVLPRANTFTRPHTGDMEAVFGEIPDSDDELDAFSPSPLKASSVHQTSQLPLNATQNSRHVSALSRILTAGESIDTSTSNVGAPTTLTPAPRVQMQPVSSSAREAGGEPASPTTAIRRVQLQLPSSSSRVVAGPSTPTLPPRRVQIELRQSTPGEVFEETPRPLRKMASPSLPRHTQGKLQGKSQSRSQARSQFYSQGLESQRVPLEVIRSLGPQTDRSDILISIHPEPADAIVEGTKDHEFRNYKFPLQVCRCWIYVTRPVAEVRYMAVLGPAEEPGQIDSESGIGNAEFNEGTLGFNFAHKLVQVYELNNPVPLASMKDNGLGDNPPQKYRYVPPAIVGQLLANLRCALFAGGDEDDEAGLEEWDEDGLGGVSISQELEEQIRSDIIQSTQMVPSSSQTGLGREHVIPASQEPIQTVAKKFPSAIVTTAVNAATATPGGVFARPALLTARTRSSSRIRSQEQHQQQRTTPSRKAAVISPFRPSQATTASGPSSPSPAVSETGGEEEGREDTLSAPTRPMPGSSGSSLLLINNEADEDGGSLVRLPSGARGINLSSQVIMPDSLLVDDVRQPPVIWGSEEDIDDDEIEW